MARSYIGWTEVSRMNLQEEKRERSGPRLPHKHVNENGERKIGPRLSDLDEVGHGGSFNIREGYETSTLRVEE